MRLIRDRGVVVNFGEWTDRSDTRERTPLAEYALNRCEEMFAARAWESFGYWHAVYVRERQRARYRATLQVAGKGQPCARD